MGKCYKPGLYLLSEDWLISPHLLLGQGQFRAGRPVGQEVLFAEGQSPSDRGGTEAILTFPVDLTPFQMQKKQTSQTKRRQRARSHFSEPGSSIPEDKLSTLRLEANRATSKWGPAPGQREPRLGLHQGFKSWLRCCICMNHMSSPGPGILTDLRKQLTPVS